MNRATAQRSASSLVDEAMALVSTVDVAQALLLQGQADVLFVDLREPGEREREGAIAGAFNAPRGLLEFWFDAESGKPQLVRPEVQYLLFCAAGWRSALAARTLQEMGVARVCHLGGGFTAWKAAGAPTLTPTR